MRAIPKASTLALVILAASFASAGSLVNDAGSGGDAGDASSPYQLPAWGAYTGSLATGGDSDWYQAPTPPEGLQCVSFDAAPSIASRATLSVPGPDGGRAFTKALHPDTAPRLRGGLAVPAATAARLGLENDPDANATEEQAAYNFSLGNSPASAITDDSGVPDAGITVAEAVATSGPCTGGILDLAGGDTGDIYSLEGLEGETLLLTFAADQAQGATLGLYDPAGLLLTQVSETDILEVTLPVSGTYYLGVFPAGAEVPDLEAATTVSADAEGLVTYFIGVVGDPERPGCKPHC